jgi:hypothetical protein
MMMTAVVEPLGSRNLARYGLRRGAYDGGMRRRFVLFRSGVSDGERVEWRSEFDTKRERDDNATHLLAVAQGQQDQSGWTFAKGEGWRYDPTKRP